MIEKKIKENGKHFCILVCYIFNAKWNRSRCRSRWENLDRDQYRFSQSNSWIRQFPVLVRHSHIITMNSWCTIIFTCLWIIYIQCKHENGTKCRSENIWKKCLKCFFSPNLYWNFIIYNLYWESIGKYLGRYFLLISSKAKTKSGFWVLVDVYEMAKNRKVLCKQFPSTEKNLEVPNILWLFSDLYWLLSLFLLE